MFRYVYGGKMSAIVYLFHFHDFINTRLYGILNVFGCLCLEYIRLYIPNNLTHVLPQSHAMPILCCVNKHVS